jgi:hypothetical protein
LEAFRKKFMRLSGATGRSAPVITIEAMSRAAGSDKAATRQRLAEALRANLGRRKAQKKDWANPPQAAAADETAQSRTIQSETAQQSKTAQSDALTSGVPSPENST